MRKNPNYEMNQIERQYQETNPQMNTRNRTNIQINNPIKYTNSTLNTNTFNISNTIQQRLNFLTGLNHVLNDNKTISKKGKLLKRKLSYCKSSFLVVAHSVQNLVEFVPRARIYIFSPSPPFLGGFCSLQNLP